MTDEYDEALEEWKDFKSRNPHFQGSNGLRLGVVVAIEEALTIARDRQWQLIETLDDWGKPMLLGNSSGAVAWEGKGFMPYSDTNAAKIIPLDKITHWQPLSAPPKDNSETTIKQNKH